jgi:hypothetical protein
MRRRFALIWLGVTALISAVVGGISYQAGWSAGVATRLPEGAAPAYYYAPHLFGFGLLPLLFIVLVLALIFRGGRRWAPWGWGGGWAGGPRGYYGGWASGPRGYYGGGPAPTAPPTTPPPADDPMSEWPQRPPSQPGPSGPQQV